MERLTRTEFESVECEPYVYGGIEDYGDSYGGKVINKLAEYEDAEEQGLLLRLPCKVGDTVYRLVPKTYRNIVELKVKKFVFCENGLCFVTEKTPFYYSCDEFGEFIFLTKEEAEQALANM